MDILNKVKSWLNKTTTNKIIGVTVVIYLCQLLLPQSDFIFALYPIESEHFIITQYLTAVFAHGGILHIGFNMYMLWMIGTMFEKQFGKTKLLYFYLIVGVGANLLTHGVSYSLSLPVHPGFGASGAIFGLLIVYGVMQPNKLIRIMFIPMGIKAKYLIGGYVLLEVFLLLTGSNDGTGHMTHLCGGLIGYLYYSLRLKSSYYNPSDFNSRYISKRNRNRR